MSAAAAGERRATPLRVALGEYDTGWHDPAGSLERAADVVERAAAAGAGLVLLPEMSTTGFTMESAAWAEPLSGPSVERLGSLARRSGVHLLAGVATRCDEQGQECFFNSALLFGADGELKSEYRKQRLFAYAGEHQHYSEGAGPVIFEVDGVRIAPFICFDLRFPELFRSVAPQVDAVALIASWPAARRMHWDALVHARAIENQCYFVAVNRSGEGGGLAYDGGSVAYDPWGDRLADTASAPGEIPVVEIDPAEVTRIRSRYPFVQDQRG